jgi:peptide/nickel transport system substrate-binding protein
LAADKALAPPPGPTPPRAVLEAVPYLPTGRYFGNTAYRRSITPPISAVMACWGMQRA